MNKINRMRQLAGILTEGVMAVPTAGGSEANMQTAGNVGRGADAAAFDAAQPPVTEIAQGMDECANDEVVQKSIERINSLVDSFVDPDKAIDRVIEELRSDGHTPEEIAGIISAIDAHMQKDVPGDDYDMDADVTQAGYEMPVFEDELEEGLPQPMDRRTAEKLRKDVDQKKWANHRADDEKAKEQPKPVEEAFDLNNGYDDIHFMSPGDFFPDGADSPVVSSTGAAGARHGDNPEQKKMAVAETHKELVYNYRNFLKESSKLNELSKGTLKSYSKKKGEKVKSDKDESDLYRGHSEYATNVGDPKSAKAWDADADFLDKRAEKGASNITKAVIKTAKK